MALKQKRAGLPGNRPSVRKAYDFTDEESDFIPSTKLRAGINYDIKYRMGHDAENEEE